MAVCLCFVVLCPSAFAVDEPRLKSTDECLLIDIATGKELYSINPDQNHSIASLTKIMTVLLAVEAAERGEVSLDEMITATANVRYGMDTSSSNADIVQGESIRYEDLMYLALVHSANDACNVLGEYLGGSIVGFTQMMNKRAQELGCTNTQFNDTCGMLNRSEGHYSSAYDLYRITSEALKHSEFYKICTTVDYTVPATNYHTERQIHNSNALISENGLYGSGYLYDGVAGVKTGFTKPAGYCLVSTCEKNGLHLMCIVLGCNGPLTYTVVPGEYQNFLDSATLYDWAYQNFSYKTIFLAGERLKRMNVQFAKDDESVAIAPSENLELLLANEITDNQIHIEVDVKEENLVAPIATGDVLGRINVYVSDELYYSCDAVAATSVDIEKSQAVKNSIGGFFSSKGFKIAVAVIITLIVVLAVLYLYLKIKRRQHLQRRIQAQERRRAQQYYENKQRRRQAAQDYDDYDDDDADDYFGGDSQVQYYDDEPYEDESDDEYYQEEAPVYQPPAPRQSSAPRQTTPDWKWEEANLDDILRSLGIDPDDINK